MVVNRAILDHRLHLGHRRLWLRCATVVFAASLVVDLASDVTAATAGASPRATTAGTPIGALLATLSDPAASTADWFGFSVAVTGTIAVVGAPATSSGAGAAYIYVKGASGWPTTPTTTLKDPTATSGDDFGWSVAVSGTTAVVGAGGVNSYAGAAYIYVKRASGWPTTPTTTLSDPAATSWGLFSWSVAVSQKTVVIGADSYAGAAYIYVKGASGWPTTPTTTLADPAAPTRDSFGWSVAVSGTTAVVSAFGTNSGAGAAYIYVKGASGWPTTPTTTLADPAATAGDYFGWSVAVSGTTAIVGAEARNSSAGAAYIYVKGASGWPTTPTTALADPAATGGDSFGFSVAVSGKTVVVGASGTNSGAGATYIYVKRASGWPKTPTTTLSDPAATADGVFGYSVTVSGKTAVVGAYGTSSDAGAAYIYRA